METLQDPDDGNEDEQADGQEEAKKTRQEEEEKTRVRWGKQEVGWV